MDEHKDGLVWPLIVTTFCYLFTFLHEHNFVVPTLNLLLLYPVTRLKII